MSQWQHLELERKDRVLSVYFDSGNPVNSLYNALMRELNRLAADLHCAISASL